MGPIDFDDSLGAQRQVPAADGTTMIWKQRREAPGAGAQAAMVGSVETSRDGDAATPAEVAFERMVHEAALLRRFHLHYQPLVSVVDEAVVGVEALLRWDCDTGRVPPGRFIPVLEATGLMPTVGEWVLAEACAELAGWAPPGDSVQLTVNVSAAQLVPGFADVVLGTLTRAGFPADRLWIDLTNPARLADPLSAWAELRHLKTRGVKLLIDDFGTAGASLVDLKRFVIDAVKIDSSFVDGVGLNPEDDTVVAALTGLAHALGMQVVAEGVETAEQLEHLRTLGCDFGQGHYFGAPAPAPALRDRITEAR
jgi:EAL domain-containing protein (putative c-di-GMP-specific phosphodiesterase class I)